MLYQWSHSHMQLFSTEQKLHDKKGSRSKKSCCKKIVANSCHVCQGTYLKFLLLGSFLTPELIWDSPYSRAMRYHLHFRGHISLTDYNFHVHVEYCITVHYHICHMDKYRHVEGPTWHNFGRLGISCFEQEGFCKTHPKSWESFLHIPSPTWGDLMSFLC